MGYRFNTSHLSPQQNAIINKREENEKILKKELEEKKLREEKLEDKEKNIENEKR